MPEQKLPFRRRGEPHDRCTLLSCAWGASAALAAAVHDRAAEHDDGAARRQADAFQMLTATLDHLVVLADIEVDRPTFDDLWRLLTRRLRQVAAATARAAPIAELLPLPQPAPAGLRPDNLWSLAWIAAGRLSEALDGIVATAPTAVRMEQAKALAALDAALRHVLARRGKHTAGRRAAIKAALDAFDRADAAIGATVPAIFAAEESWRPATGRAA